MNLLIPLLHLLKVGEFVYFSFGWFLPYLGSVFCPRTPFFHALLKQFHFRRILLVVFTNIIRRLLLATKVFFIFIPGDDADDVASPPVPSSSSTVSSPSEILSRRSDTSSLYQDCKIHSYNKCHYSIYSYSVCQIREDKTYLKLSTSRLKLVLSFSAISSLLSICSLALLSLSRSRSISAFSLRDCSRSCSTANKSYLRKTEKLSVMKTRMLLENFQALNFLIVPQLLLVLF